MALAPSPSQMDPNSQPSPGAPLRRELERVLRHLPPRRNASSRCLLHRRCKSNLHTSGSPPGWRAAPALARAVRAVRACPAAGAARMPGLRPAHHHQTQAACRARARTERIVPRPLHLGGGAGLTRVATSAQRLRVSSGFKYTVRTRLPWLFITLHLGLLVVLV